MSENNVQHPKVVVIGAGSLFFGRQAIWQMVQSPYLNKGTLSFVDIDESKLNKMVTLGKMVAEANNVELHVEGSTDRKEVLKGADFVILSFAKDSIKYRGIDCEISKKYGILMCSGDTTGPGGIFRAMREFPVILECAKDIEAICPDAWVVSYINPTAVHGLGLKRYAPKLKSFALCDSQHMPHIKKRYAKMAGIIDNIEDYNEDISRKFDFRIAGVNHFTWLVKAEYEGKDMTPQIAAATKADVDAQKYALGGDTGAKAFFVSDVAYELYKGFGMIPTCTGHTKEYVRFWQGHGKTVEEIPPLSTWNTAERYRITEKMWNQIDMFIDGRTPIEDYMKTFKADHATDIIENMVGNLGKPFYINTFNEGAVTNMNNDSFLELCCNVTMDGVKTLPVGKMPRGIRGMCEIILDTHELTAEAIVEHSLEKLRRAMLTDPLTNSIGDADNIIKDLLETEKEDLPKWWFE